MRAVLQRVKEAEVRVNGAVVGRIGPGLLIFVGVGHGDTERDADYLVNKTIHLRVFPDEEGKMNRSLLESGGEALVVSQFTLWADCRKGRRPSFAGAASPEEAERLYEYVVARIREQGVATQTGTFRAMMEVRLVNDGPVTLLLDSRN